MKRMIRIALCAVLAGGFWMVRAQDKPTFDKVKLAQALMEEAAKGRMDLAALKRSLIKAGMEKKAVDRMSRAELFEFISGEMSGEGFPFGGLPKVPDIADDPDFDKERFAELMMDEAHSNGGQLELSLDKFRDWMIEAGMNKDKVEKMSVAEVMGFLVKNLGSMGLPGLPGGMAFNEEDVGKLDTQFQGLLDGHRPALKEAHHGTIGMVSDDQLLALGTVVDARGLVISKASEVKKGGRKLKALIGEKQVPARVIREWKDHDLALLQVKAKGLKPVTWYEGKLPDIGAFLTTPGIEGDEPIGIGLLSVKTRKLTNKDTGFLGIGVGEAETGVKVSAIIPDTPAARSGLKVDDVILSLNGKMPESVPDFISRVGKRKPNERVNLEVVRGEEKKQFEIRLMERPKQANRQDGRSRQMSQMGGALSKVRDGFPNAFQHDIPLEPMLIGGPVVDLHGRVIGVNIARASRIKTYALPVGEITALLDEVDFDKLAKANSDAAEINSESKPETDHTAKIAKAEEARKLAALKEQDRKAKAKLESARKALQKAEQQAKAAEKALQNAER